MTTKVKRAKIQAELLHHFANKLRPSQKLGNNRYENNCFYYNDECIARILDNKQKILLYKPFNKISTYGNGLTHSQILKVFDDSYNKYEIDNILDINDKFTKKDKYIIALYNIKDRIIREIDRYARAKYLLENPKCYFNYSYSVIPTSREYVSMWINNFKLSERKILGHVFNITNHETIVSYIGWNRAITVTENYKYSISFWTNPALWFSTEEKEELKFRDWKRNHCNKGVSWGNTTYREIYFNKEYRETFEKQVQTYELKRIKEIEEKQLKQAEEEKFKNLKLVEDWYADKTNNINLWDVPILLKLTHKNKFITTSRGAVIPIKDAKKLYKLYLNVKQKGLEYFDKSMKIGYYDFKHITKYSTSYTIKIGCHLIREAEIEEFIERNNLQDWKNI